jgi:F-type H+-transporting ATPase subunit epsilon
MKLTLQTPYRILVGQREITELFAPGVAGTLDILPGHADFLSELGTGILKWKASGGDKHEEAAVTWGFIQIKNQEITVLADVAELSEEIDVKRAEEAAKKAKKILEEGGVDDANFRKHELKLQRAIARQGVGN